MLLPAVEFEHCRLWPGSKGKVVLKLLFFYSLTIYCS